MKNKIINHIWNIMSKLHYNLPTRTDFFALSAGKMCRSSKLNFSSCYFIENDSHIKIVWLHAVVFSGHNIFHF